MPTCVIKQHMKIDHHLLEKYWSGQSTPAERAAVEAWMADGISKEDFSLHTDQQSAEHQKIALWQSIRQETETVHLSPGHTKKTHIKRWYTIAAVAAILCAFSTLYLLQTYFSKGLPQAISYTQIVVPFGEKQKLTLSDGTEIFLNSGTRIKFPQQFEANKRMVFLEGEAFFKVSKDPNRPFIVQTEKTSTKVLGTRFNLLGRKGKAEILTVEEGRVQFSARGCLDTLILTANMQSTYKDGKMDLREVRSGQSNAWTTGQLIFNGNTLQEVIPELERWYNIKINCKDADLLDYRIKGDFKQASLTQVIHDISFALAIQYTIKDKEVSLYK